MNARRSDLERAANEYASERIEVDGEQVATLLVQQIVDEHMVAVVPSDVVENGVVEAIAECDEESFYAVVDLVSERVHLEVEAQAKRIALRLLGEMATQARQDWQARREASVAAE